MITYSSTYRSGQSEVMDNFDLQGEEMKLLMVDLNRVNKWLGGTTITLNGVEELLKTTHKGTTITILDLGCGDGEMLRNCERWAKKRGQKLQLIGIDANTNILEEAKISSAGSKSSTFQTMDVFSEDTVLPEFDIALCTLFLHHFKEAQIIDLLSRIQARAKVGIVVNDLHRSRWAFWLFKLFSSVFLRTAIARHDGLVSVARGFKKHELERFSKQIKGHHQIGWKWAFRYQWLIKK